MYIERIQFERTGGFAGIRLAADIELDKLPEEQKREIIEMMDELDFEELPGKLSAKPPIPDEFFYSITVISEKQEYKVLTGESNLPQKMQPLVDLLMQITKRQMRRN